MSGLQNIVYDLMQTGEEEWITSSQTEIILENLERDAEDPSRQVPVNAMPPRPDSNCGVQALDSEDCKDAVVTDFDYSTLGEMSPPNKVEPVQEADIQRSTSCSPQDFTWLENKDMSGFIRYTPPPPYPHHGHGGEGNFTAMTTSRSISPPSPRDIKQEVRKRASGETEAGGKRFRPEGQSVYGGLWGETTSDLANVQDSVTPLIKLELRDKITSRRLQQGLEPTPCLDTPQRRGSQLSEADRIRRERRRESNRRAAAKCRVRKQNEAKQKTQEYSEMKKENVDLKAEVARLRERIRESESKMALHRKHCNLTSGQLR